MENVIFEKKGAIAVLTVSRPKALNALNKTMLIELEQAVQSVREDENVRCVIITGAGEKAFAAGADIKEMRDLNFMAARELGMLGNRVFSSIEQLNVPVIAAVNGYALGGGCELALSCDIRIASDDALFGQPETTLGITPGFGGTQRLARAVGPAAAKEMIFTGSAVKADEALRIGLVNHVVPKSELLDAALELAGKIALNAPIAVKLAKSAINRGMQSDISTALAYESEAFAECFASEDQTYGMDAFIRKIKEKEFKGK